MTPSPGSNSLSVVLGAQGEAEEVLSVLTDYAAAGLVAPFVWVDAAEVDKGSVPATFVRDGRSEPVLLQRLLTGNRYHRLRIAVLVVADAPAAQRVPRSAERALERVVRSGAFGSSITLLRLLFTHGAVVPASYDPALVLEGWHNLLVAPEDSGGPDLGGSALERLTDPLDVAQYVAPVVAAVSGLWSGIDETVFDDLAILPGRTLRAVRAHYRQLDATGVEDQLRHQLFGSSGRLPLPHGGTIPVVHVSDAPLAAQTMARSLWTKHRNVLRGSRVTVGEEEAKPISARVAIKMFLSFLGTALRNAPSTWVSGMLTSMSSVLATTVQHAVFGRSGSAYSVVTSGELSSWQDIGRGADEMSTVLDSRYGPTQLVQADLTPLWLDYANGALTLADGGRRSAGMEPINVGAAIGVVPGSSGVVPSAADAFDAVPASLAALTGVARVAGGDVLAAAELEAVLQRAFGDPVAGVEARQAHTSLTAWESWTSKSYAGQVGSILADFLNRARAEVGDVVQSIKDASGRIGVDEQLRRRQQVITTIIRTAGWIVFAVLVVLLVIAGIGWVDWRFSLTVGAVVVVLYFLAAFTLYVLAQRHLFAEMNLRRSQIGELQAMHTNLRAALQDVSRLSQAYGQFLSWNRVLGELLRTPFGPVPASKPRRLLLADGLPRSVRIGVAAPTDHDAAATAHALQQRLFTVGWMTDPWTQLLESAGARLGGENPAALFAMPGVGSGSVLDAWSSAVAGEVRRPEGVNSLWLQAQAILDDPGSHLAGALTGGVFIQGSGQRLSPEQFNGGVLQARNGSGAPFDESLFTDTAVTAGRSAVAIDNATVARDGLGYRAVVIQVGDGLPTYDFSLFGASRTPAAEQVDEDVPPGSGAQVF
ncbi:ABC-type multidrug transport system fused ATPase/permease subunit [Mycobacterium frederiksbergense]|uniref:ABC-type multidrug transport system fused ATPase/permease subunit n=1 Tax=Mycolicibacterium frederiksbergense TaxID=117567 RepID=A0ABT6L008_9MYCO|nr:hypothetical protein [Mycolicibacterium frederiksbergense]MDH6196281.1 ABC-type multidrug transport system fused ATPase/permease subunit [Mycolicibacterium frederiksbergense]